MDQSQDNTPSKLSTRYFPPNKWQVLGSAYYVPKPRRKRRISLLTWILASIALVCLAYAGTYFVLSRVVG